MTRFRYSQEMLNFIEAGFKQMQVPELTVAFNEAFNLDKTEGQIRACLKNNKFTCGRPPGNPKGTFRLFTKEQADFLRESYRKYSLIELTARVNAKFGTGYTVQQVRSLTRNQHMKSGRTGQFEKGSVPFNKGTKGLMKPNRTSFKKGNMSGAAQHNYKPIGSTRISKDGYLERKVTDDHPTPARRWVGEHRLVWEAANGPIPGGHVVVFLDGDKMNCTLNNLRCVPRGVLQYMNKTGLNETAGESRKAAILTAEVVTRTKQLQRKMA